MQTGRKHGNETKKPEKSQGNTEEALESKDERGELKNLVCSLMAV